MISTQQTSLADLVQAGGAAPLPDMYKISTGGTRYVVIPEGTVSLDRLPVSVYQGLQRMYGLTSQPMGYHDHTQHQQHLQQSGSGWWNDWHK